MCTNKQKLTQQNFFNPDHIHDYYTENETGFEKYARFIDLRLLQ